MIRLLIAIFLLILASNTLIAQWQGMRIKQVIPTTKRIYSLALSHSNGDGIPDIVALPAETFSSVEIYHGSSEHQFNFSSSFTKDENYRVLETGDLDSDGIDDLVLSSYWGNGFKIYWSNAGGNYIEGNYFGLTGHGKNLDLVDIDGDNDLDIVAFSGGSGQPITLHLFKNNRSRSIVSAGIFGSVLDTDKRITIVDKNEDGLLDVMVASSFPWFVIFYQQNNGSFIPRYWPHKIELPFTSEYYLADFDNDSREDIAASYFGEGIRFHRGLSDTLFTEDYKLYQPKIKPFQLFPVDLNKDGFTDLIAQHQSEDYEPTDSLFYMIGRGDFTFEEPQLIKFPSNVEKVLIADFNNDGFADIIAYTSEKGIVTVLNEGLVTGVEDKIEPPSIFPNPFINHLKIESRQPESIIDVLDSRGVTLERAFGKDIVLETSSWPQGIYFVKVQVGAHVSIQKIVK